jgi:hypothetical protein
MRYALVSLADKPMHSHAAERLGATRGQLAVPNRTDESRRAARNYCS